MAFNSFRLFTLILSLALLSGPGLAAEPIRIGSFLSLSEDAAYLGEPERQTLQLYIERINQQGGVLERPLQLIYFDVSDNIERTQGAVKRLLEVDQVDLIIGGSTTRTALAAIPLVEKARVPLIALAAGSQIVEPVKPWVFKTAPTDHMAVRKIFADMQARGIRRLALLAGQNEFGTSGSRHAATLAPGYGLEIVHNDIYSRDSTLLRAQLRHLQTDEPEAVLIFDAGESPALITRLYRQLELPWPLYHSHGVASPRFIELAQGAADGVRLPASPLLFADQLPDTDPQKPVLIGYRDAFQQRYHTPVSTFGGHAYDALMIAVDALRRAGSTDKAQVRQALEDTTGYLGTAGEVNMSPRDHVGVNLDGLRMVEIRNSRWYPLQTLTHHEPARASLPGNLGRGAATENAPPLALMPPALAPLTWENGLNGYANE